jgi:hypothetical protein
VCAAAPAVAPCETAAASATHGPQHPATPCVPLRAARRALGREAGARRARTDGAEAEKKAVRAPHTGEALDPSVLSRAAPARAGGTGGVEDGGAPIARRATVLGSVQAAVRSTLATLPTLSDRIQITPLTRPPQRSTSEVVRGLQKLRLGRERQLQQLTEEREARARALGACRGRWWGLVWCVVRRGVQQGWGLENGKGWLLARLAPTASPPGRPACSQPPPSPPAPAAPPHLKLPCARALDIGRRRCCCAPRRWTRWCGAPTRSCSRRGACATRRPPPRPAPRPAPPPALPQAAEAAWRPRRRPTFRGSRRGGRASSTSRPPTRAPQARPAARAGPRRWPPAPRPAAGPARTWGWAARAKGRPRPPGMQRWAAAAAAAHAATAPAPAAAARPARAAALAPAPAAPAPAAARSAAAPATALTRAAPRPTRARPSQRRWTAFCRSPRRAPRWRAASSRSTLLKPSSSAS